jgi:hypothetical protein
VYRAFLKPKKIDPRYKIMPIATVPKAQSPCAQVFCLARKGRWRTLLPRKPARTPPIQRPSPHEPPKSGDGKGDDEGRIERAGTETRYMNISRSSPEIRNHRRKRRPRSTPIVIKPPALKWPPVLERQDKPKQSTCLH